MKILLACYRFLLFFMVTWTAYNTTLFFDWVVPWSSNIHVPGYLYRYANLYLLGSLDFHDLVFGVSHFVESLSHIDLSSVVSDLFVCTLFINGVAIYAWLCRQTPLSACGLATAAWGAGPYLDLVFSDYRLWAHGYAATLFFYLLLIIASLYRRLYFPDFRLPPWLQWRQPDLVPSPLTIGRKIVAIFKKRRKADPDTGADIP